MYTYAMTSLIYGGVSLFLCLAIVEAVSALVSMCRRRRSERNG